jgi:hypothetical protein
MTQNINCLWKWHNMKTILQKKDIWCVCSFLLRLSIRCDELNVVILICYTFRTEQACKAFITGTNL